MNIHHNLFLLLLFLFFIFTGFAHCSLYQSQYLFDRNVTTSKIDVFYDSMERIATTFNDHFAEIARKIRVISEGQLNSSDSICYRSIVQVLESGYRYKWSAKSKFLKIKMGYKLIFLFSAPLNLHSPLSANYLISLVRVPFLTWRL
mgnify:CR=1 FL=1